MLIKRTVFVVLALMCFLSGISQKTHVVMSGENLGTIARTYQVSVIELKQWNSIEDIDRLSIGAELFVENPRSYSYNRTKDPSTTSLGDQISGKRNSSVTDTKEVKKTEIKDQKHSNRLSDGKQNATNEPSSLGWLWILLGVLFGVVAGVFLGRMIFLNKAKKKFDSEKNELITSLTRLEGEKVKLDKDIQILRSQSNKLKKENENLLEENVSLGEQLEELKVRIQREGSCPLPAAVKDKADTHQADDDMAQASVLYSDAIFDNCFEGVCTKPTDDTIFILRLTDDSSAEFSVYDKAYQKVIANPSFLEGCEKQIMGDSIRLEVVSLGTATRNASNGKWHIINKLNVIIK